MTITSPEQAGVSPKLNSRTALIASLRTIANLLEDIPEVPLLECKEIRWGVLGSDAEALPVIEDLRTALSAEGVTHTVDDNPCHAIAVEVPLVGGFKARFVHVYDQSVADYEARSSYNGSVQVDAERAEAVA